MANQYLYDLTDTWNNVATTFDAIKMNVTDTASAAGSKLLNLQVGGTPKFTVQNDGAVALTGAVTGATSITASGTVTADLLTVTKTTANASAITSTGYSLTGSNASSLVDLAGTWNTTGAPIAFKLNVTESSTPNSASLLLDLQRGGVSQFSVRRDGTTTAKGTFDTSANLNVAGNAFLYGSSSYLAFGTTYDAILRSDAANIVVQRNGTNAQTFRVYKTFTDASNYERTEIAHATGTGTYAGEYCILRAATAGTGADNLNLVLSPAGTGAIMAQLPDGTTTGGIARGANSVDLQTERNSASSVASGSYSVVLGGLRNVASNTYSVCLAGRENSCTGNNAISAGYQATASGSVALAMGQQITASASYSSAFGYFSTANKYGQTAFAAGRFADQADAQRSTMVLRNATTDATATELFLDGSSARATIPNNTCWHADIRIVGRQSTGANHATYHRKCTIYKNTTAASTTLVGTVQTIGTDEESDANWAVAVTADTTNGSLKIEVTGVAATNIRWVAELSVVEVAYA